MCGIAGYFDGKNMIDREKFEKMIDIIEHRGPSDRGLYCQDNLALGHRRLAIVDLSIAGHQPFFFENRYVVVYNGEIYNYKKIRADLAEKGYHFKTQTDTEVLIAAYDYYGKECVHYFNGMWAFAIFDKKKNVLYCSRDRFGVKPFYYYVDDQKFIFGSEIKQILCVMDKKPVANKNRLLDYLVCGDQDHTSETMFDGIMQLRGGYEIIYNLDEQKMKLSKYYDVINAKKEKKEYKEDCEIFRKRFTDSVKIRMNADVPVGYCLSGGLDSSAIVCVANKINRNTEQHAVSACYESKEYDEQEYIDEVISKTGIHSHKIFPQNENLFNEIDNIIWHMDEPFGSTSIYAQWNVFKKARQCGLTVMMDGQGADEQLGGYSSFYSVYFAYLVRHGKILKLLREIKEYSEKRASTESYINSYLILVSAMIAAFFPRNIYNRFNVIYRKMKRTPFSRNQINLVYGKRKMYPVNNIEQYIEDSMKCGMQSLLHYEDRNSMAFSIESRVPFLDYKLVESIYGMRFEHKMRNGVTKAVMRDGLKGILPEKIRKRYSKLGFATPEDQWINDNFDQYKKELKSACIELEGLLDKERVLKWFDSHKGKMTRGDFTVWRIICAGRWMKVFNVSLEENA